jgi:Ca2+/Na+ antiporter
MYKYIKYLPCAFLIAFVIKFMFIPVIYAEAIVFVACAALYAYHLIREDKSKEESEALEQRFQDLTDELGHMNKSD